jgi:hypothetical protein
MTTTRLSSILAFGLFALAALGCGDSGERPTCDEIGETCHPSTTDAGIACHEKAEDAATTEDECVEMEEACLAECQ